MSSPGSLKSLSKTITTHISTLTTPLPDDLIEVIESYLRKHEKHDDASSEKLQDELFSIHSKHVAGHPERLTGFIAVLSQLLPALRSPSRLLQWWDLLRDEAKDGFSTEKGLMSESFSALLNLLSRDDVPSDEHGGPDLVNPFVERLISLWMEQYQGAALGSSVDRIEKAVRESLMFYGKRRPKNFMTILDAYFVKAETRTEAATLLGEFIRSQPPHLHQVLGTPLFSNLLRCLQLDTSTTVVSLTLTALTMLLPYTPSSLVPHLPTLFNIYARLLFWQGDRSDSTDFPGDQAQPRPLVDPAGWDICSYSEDVDGHDIPSLRYYFTILYGLYPINFMDYIRKPHRYLRHAKDPNADAVEVQPSEIRHKSEEFRRGHLLHPNFYNLTIESEKTDHGRWQASEPAEVVAECTALSIMEDQFVPGLTADGLTTAPRTPSLSSKEETSQSISDSALLNDDSRNAELKPSESSARDSLEMRSHSIGGGDSPTLPPHLPLSSSHTQLQDLIHSNKVIKSGLHQSLANDSVPSLSLSQHESISEGPGGSAQRALRSRAESSLDSATDKSSLVSQLQRQILLLQNDLSFERYLKQQHMAHMGELRRRQVKEAASEAEMQNLIIANRNLKNRSEEAKKAEMQVKKESEKSRGLAKKWEADLSAKLKTLREEARKTKARVGELERELERVGTECEKLKAQVCVLEVRELNWQQNLQSHEIDKSEMDRMKAEIERLTITERDFQAKESDMKRAVDAAAVAESQIQVLDAKLAARDQELDRIKEAYESQVASLRSRVVKETHDTSTGRSPPSINDSTVAAALSASRAKQAELQRQHSLLIRKYTILQSSLLDMQCDPILGANYPGHHHDAPTWSEGDGSPTGQRSPTQSHQKPHRVFSNPEGFDATSPYKATLSSDGRASTSPGEPAEAAGSASAMSASPESRFYSRGGIGSRVRKGGAGGKEDKKAPAEGPEKKDKKAGLRGIRSFHVA